MEAIFVLLFIAVSIIAVFIFRSLAPKYGQKSKRHNTERDGVLYYGLGLTKESLAKKRGFFSN